LSFDPDVRKRARELAEKYLDDPSSLPATLVTPILGVAAAGGDAPLYDRYVAAMKAATAQPEQYYRLFGSLPAFTAPELRARTLAFALSDDARSQDAPQMIAQLLGSESSQDAAWAFVQSEWPALTAKLGTFQGIPAIVGALSGYCSTEKAAEIKQFFAAHPVPEAARALQLTQERIASCVALKSRQSPAFEQWLAGAKRSL
jgi:puromycin-sensitive aminopeptidase